MCILISADNRKILCQWMLQTNRKTLVRARISISIKQRRHKRSDDSEEWPSGGGVDGVLRGQCPWSATSTTVSRLWVQIWAVTTVSFLVIFISVEAWYATARGITAADNISPNFPHPTVSSCMPVRSLHHCGNKKSICVGVGGWAGDEGEGECRGRDGECWGFQGR